MKLTYPELFYDHLSGQMFTATTNIILQAEKAMKAVLYKDLELYPSRTMENVNHARTIFYSMIGTESPKPLLPLWSTLMKPEYAVKSILLGLMIEGPFYTEVVFRKKGETA